jgi:NAD(P)-dependent dehydrogenase (short-subunit alcohol dehydrogenase family)
MTKKTVLITGSSSGFGKLAANTFHNNGWNVIATMRSPERETELNGLSNVLVTKLDVTDPASIKQAVDEGIARFGAIHVLVNNAGYGGHAVFEQASDESIRAMYETNVFGVMNVSRAVLPLMRRQREGRIINVTSMAGMMAAPTISVYASSKHAVQGLTEGMALEYAPLGILVKSVLPGAYPTTGFNANTDDDLKAGDSELVDYAQKVHGHLMGVAEQMARQGGQVADPQEVADTIYECATSETPVHNPVGADVEMLIAMMGTAPRQPFLDKLSEMLLPPR